MNPETTPQEPTYTNIDAVIDQLDEAREMLISLRKLAPTAEAKQIDVIDRRLFVAKRAANSSKATEQLKEAVTTAAAKPPPISVRNNNPGNIRPTAPGRSRWQGEVNTDNGYAKFKGNVYGTRAMLYLLCISYPGHGINTISGIIDRYAPSHDNSPAARDGYNTYLEQATGYGRNEILDLTDKNTIFKLAKGIAAYESGLRDSHVLVGTDGHRILHTAYNMLPL